MFDFPANPSIGQPFVVSGITYIFDGVAWNVSAAPNPAALTAQARNRIVNPAMQISQERGDTLGGPTGSSSMSFYPADQFTGSWSTTGTVSFQRIQSVTPNGSKDRIRMTASTADASLAAGEVAYMATLLEGSNVADFRYGLASAKQSVLRFGWKSPAGTYSVSLTNVDGTRTYIANFTVTAANTDTEYVLAIPGDVTGTWTTDAACSIKLFFTIAAGTTYHGVAGWQAGNKLGTASTSNGLATAGNTFELFDVGLHLDPLGTGVAPPFQVPDYGDDLLACKRYWQQTTAYYAANISISLTYYVSYKYTMPTRTTPTLSGVVQSSSGFPATVGTLSDLGPKDGCVETLPLSSTSGACVRRTDITVNARM